MECDQYVLATFFYALPASASCFLSLLFSSSSSKIFEAGSSLSAISIHSSSVCDCAASSSLGCSDSTCCFNWTRSVNCLNSVGVRPSLLNFRVIIFSISKHSKVHAVPGALQEVHDIYQIRIIQPGRDRSGSRSTRNFLT